MKFITIYNKRKLRKEKKLINKQKIYGYLTYKLNIPYDLVKHVISKY